MPKETSPVLCLSVKVDDQLKRRVVFRLLGMLNTPQFLSPKSIMFYFLETETYSNPFQFIPVCQSMQDSFECRLMGHISVHDVTQTHLKAIRPSLGKVTSVLQYPNYYCSNLTFRGLFEPFEVYLD